MKQIVLLHGWGQEAPQHLESFASSLRSKGYDVFLPHLPGFGKTPQPTFAWDVSDYVQWVHHEVCEVKQWRTFIVCGHSFGGRIALKFAVAYPETVQKLILIASAGLRQNLSYRARILQIVSKFGKKTLSLPVLRVVHEPAHQVWKRLLGRKDYYKVSGVMQETFLKVITEDLAPLLSQIVQPTFILWGKKDQYVSVADAEVMHAAISNSVIKLYSQADHFLPYAEPDALAEDIDEFAT